MAGAAAPPDPPHRPARDRLVLAAAGTVPVAAFVLQAVLLGRRRFVDPDYGGAPRATWVVVGLQLMALGAAWIAARAALRLPARVALPIVVVVFSAVAAAALATGPARSQDLNLNLLLAKGWVRDGLNPYLTKPLALQRDTWAPSRMAWDEQPMTHGPLWTLLLALAVACTWHLPVAILIMKSLALAALVVSGVLLWRILAVLGRAPASGAAILLLLAWNPFVVQTTLVDVHNDVFVLVAILAAALAYLRGGRRAAFLPLVASGFIKYALWGFLIVPGVALWRARGARGFLRDAAPAALLWGALAAVLFAPFGWSRAMFGGLHEEITARGWSAFYWPGAAFLGSIPGMTVYGVRAAGAILAVFTAVVCLRRGGPLLPWTLPWVAALFFGFPSFHPWYALWVAPLGAAVVPAETLLASSVPLVVDELAPRAVLWAIALGPAVVAALLRVRRASFPAPAAPPTGQKNPD